MEKDIGALPLRLLKRRSARGDARATYLLAKRYNSGDGVAQDSDEAARLLLTAAELGDADARCDVGSMYYFGMHGHTPDFTKAVRWLRPAAEQGHANARYIMGLCCADGHGVPQDLAEAARWYRLAAEQGQEDAQYKMALWCSIGQGVPVDTAEAVRWYRLAADGGSAEAQITFGALTMAGVGVVQDVKEGAQMVRRGCELDSSLDPYELLDDMCDGLREVVSKCCIVCARTGRGLKKCERCRVAVFCCQDHLRRAWKAHKPYCREWSAATDAPSS